MEPVILRTARLELSRPVVADIDVIFEACQDPEIQRYTTVPTPYARQHAESFVEKVAADWTDGAHLTWAMRHEDALVGMIGMYRIDGKGTGELGYWMARPARGRGLLTEAARAVIDWGFAAEGLDLDRIEWKAIAGNMASARAARALGFRYEGLLRQGLVSQHGRDDGWIAALLRADDREQQPWTVLGEPDAPVRG